MDKSSSVLLGNDEGERDEECLGVGAELEHEPSYWKDFERWSAVTYGRRVGTRGRKSGSKKELLLGAEYACVNDGDDVGAEGDGLKGEYLRAGNSSVGEGSESDEVEMDSTSEGEVLSVE